MRCGIYANEAKQMSWCFHSIGSTVLAGSTPVEGIPTRDRCPSCGKDTVVIVYHRLASRVLFCTSCQHVWTARGPTTAASFRLTGGRRDVREETDDHRSTNRYANPIWIARGVAH